MRPRPAAPPDAEMRVTATPFFEPDGRLWPTYAVSGNIYGAVSRDEGKSVAPLFVIAAPGSAILDDNGEAWPEIVALADGTLVASCAMWPEKS